MRQEALINELNELERVVKAKRAGGNSVYIYTTGRHDRSVQKALFSRAYRIADISTAHCHRDAGCYIYAVAEEKAGNYLEP